MRSTLFGWLRSQYALAAARFRDWLRRRAEECHHCRECAGEVAPLEEVCPHCGAGSPAQMGISPIAATIFGVGVVLLLLAIFV